MRIVLQRQVLREHDFYNFHNEICDVQTFFERTRDYGKTKICELGSWLLEPWFFIFLSIRIRHSKNPSFEMRVTILLTALSLSINYCMEKSVWQCTLALFYCHDCQSDCHMYCCRCSMSMIVFLESELSSKTPSCLLPLECEIRTL